VINRRPSLGLSSIPNVPILEEPPTYAARIHTLHLPLLLACFVALLTGCYERKQAMILNPDGSGKVVIETEAELPAVAAPGQGKPSAIEFGRSLARDLINKTQGIEGWSDLSIRQTPDGRAHVSATAYFSDISRLRFDFPILFKWQRQADGTYLFAVTRERNTAPPNPPGLTDDQIKEQVSIAQSSYKDRQPLLQTSLSTFNLQLTFQLPGDITETHLLTRQATTPPAPQSALRTVSFVIDGKKLSAALDKFMADDAAIATTIRSGADLMSNDDVLLESMYGQKGPVTATVRVPPDAGPVFDYDREAKAALAHEPQMLKDAGVETVPRLTVKPPATTQAK